MNVHWPAPLAVAVWAIGEPSIAKCTVAPGLLAEQIDCTLDNLRLISRAAGLGDDLGAATASERHFKVYLRHAADLEATRARLEKSLLRAGDSVTWLEADLCRATLNVEVEATVFGPGAR